jgi:response regulator NasT
MERHHISEEEAHRLLQKRSMDNGTRMAQTARLLLEEWKNAQEKD